MEIFFNIKGILQNKFDLSGDTLIWVNLLMMIVIAIVISLILQKISRFIFLSVVEKVAARTKTYWDDALVHNKFFRKLASLIPALFLLGFIPTLLEDFKAYEAKFIRVVDLWVVVIFARVSNSFFSALEEVLRRKDHLKDKPIGSYTQLAKVVSSILFGVIFLSVALDKSPIYFFSAMGAMTAILLLVFKDTILGFVASIQIAANDMLREGDWVTMTKYGADGDVEQINLTTVKVRNFDKTITTIPTYAFISDSFKNWRGMSESDGRRIKRFVSIKISSIKFCSEDMLNRYAKFQLISDYVSNKRTEISEYNTSNKIDESELVNGRHLTNIGVLRTYIESYLNHNANVNHNMTCMVRQLAPDNHGLPIEIYAFSSDKDWVNYEGIMADIFDHVLAVIPEFDLEVFESPSGDLSNLKV